MEIVNSLIIRWLLIIAVSSLIYGNLSTLISARRLFFLASVTPHSALLAVLTAVVLSNVFGVLNEFLWSALIGCCLMLIIGYTIYRGADTDIVTSLYVALSASVSVTVMNYVLTTFRVGYSLWRVVLGDPLLTTWDDLLYVSIVAILTTSLTAMTLKYHVYAGADPDYVKLVGARRWLYDFTLFLLLGITSVALIKVTGFILQHVLILLPSIIAAKVTESSAKAYLLSLMVSLTAGIAGLQIAVLINLSPSGSIGVTLIAIYAISLLIAKVRKT